jgi:AhpD family alkylhydroperoxidase
MDTRIDYSSSQVLQKFVKHFNAAAAVVKGTVPSATANLMLIRASQINGCAVCTDMHTKDAEHEGENQGGDYTPGQWG